MNQSLDEKLSGKTDSEKQALLKEECLSEAEKSGGIHHTATSNYHRQKMREICREMSEEFSATPSNSAK